MKNTIDGQQASENTMPMEITPFNPPYYKWESLICHGLTIRGNRVEESTPRPYLFASAATIPALLTNPEVSHAN